MFKLRLFFLMMIGLCHFSSSVFAQAARINGVVKDEQTKEALFGANVVVKGSSQGVSTNEDGVYSLSLQPGTYQLVFSYLGYDTREIQVILQAGENQVLDVSLTEEGSYLETTVISASRFERKIGEETVSMDVIKPNFLENQNINTVDGAIKRSPGVAIVDGQINIRGGASWSYGAGSRVLILLDDIPVLQADAGSPPWGSIPIENIGQIEIIKGAASALYGSSAMNGIINIRTAYATGKPVTKVSLYSTIYDNPAKEFDEEGHQIRKDWWNFNEIQIGQITKDPATWRRPYDHGFLFGHRQKFGKLDLVVGARGTSNQGWRYGNYDNSGRISLQTRYRLTEKMNFGFNAFGTFGNSGQFFAWNGNDGANKYIPFSLVGDPTTTKGRNLSIDPFFNYFDDKGNRHKVLGRWFSISNFSTNNQGQASDYFYAEYQYQRRMEDIGLTLSGGVVGGYVTANAPLYGNAILSNRNIALYAQADKRFFDKLNVSLGIRMENNKQTDTESETKPVFRLGANYQIAEFTFIRGSVGQGYRFPTLAEKFVQTNLGQAVQIAPNPNLVSETGITSEIGFKQGFKIGGFGAFFDASVFYTRFQGMMEFNPIVISFDPLVVGFQSQNVGNTEIFGIETSVAGEGKLFRKFPMTVLLGYTYINPRYANFDPEDEGRAGVAEDINGNPYNILKYRFRHTFNGQWDVNFHGFNFGISGQYFSFMENLDRIFTVFIPGISDYREERLREGFENKKPQRWYKGDFILDLRVGYTIKKNEHTYRISALVNNVANHEYALRPAIMEAPRAFSARLDIEF